MNRRQLVAAGLATLLIGAVQAQARNYAIVSLVGDKLDIVTFQITTGAINDRNLHDAIPVSDGFFDKAALLAADDALQRIDRSAKVSLIAAWPPEWFAHQDRFFDGDRCVLPAELTATLRSAGATHLLLITKYRGDARLQARSTKLGGGKLEGMGIYIDRQTEMITSDTQEQSTGFVAPYVYVRLSLVDLGSSVVLRQQTAYASQMRSTARGKKGFNPWDAFTAEEKMNVLREMLEKEIARVVPELVGRP